MKLLQVRRRLKLGKWTTILGLVLVALPIAALVLVRTRAVRDRMRVMAIDAIHDELGLRARVRDVDVEFLPVGIVARGIRLDDPVYGHFADAEELRIQPSLTALLSGQIDLEEIELERATMWLVVRDGEIRNLPRPRRPSSDSKLPFRDLAVSDARLVVDAEPLGRGELRGVDIDLEVLPGDILELRALVERGRVRHPLGEERIDGAEVRARLAPHYVEMHLFSLRTPNFRVGLQRARIDLPIRARPIARGKVDLEVSLAHLRNLPHGFELPDLAGRLFIRGDVESDRDGVHGQGRISVREGRIDQYGLGDVDLDIELARDQLVIKHGTARIIHGAGAAELHGTIGLGPTLPLQLRTTFTDIRFARLIEQLGVTPNAIVDWNISGQAQLRGTCNPLHLDGPIRAQTRDFVVTQHAWHRAPRQRIVGVTRARVQGAVSVRPEGLRFERMSAELGHSRLEADVLLGFDNALRVRARSDRLDVRDATPLVDFPLEGTGSASVEVDGTFHLPVVKGHVAMRDFSFDDLPLGTLESDWQLEKEGLAVRFPEIEATKRSSRYRVADLLLDFSQRKLAITGEIELERMTLADFYHVFHLESDQRFEPYQGLVHGNALVHYTRGFPGDSRTGTLTTDMSLSIDQANIQGFAFRSGRFAGQWKWSHYEQGYRGGELTIEELSLAKGDGSVTASGRMAQGGALDVVIAADRIALRDTEGVSERMPQLGGTFSLVGRVGGTADTPRAHLDTSLAGVSWGNVPLGDARAYVRLTDQEDPWVRQAATWTAPPPGESCGHARMGFARGRWPEDPPIRTRNGPEPALERPMAYLVCGEGFEGQLRVDMAIGRTEVYPLRGSMWLTNLALAPFLPPPRPGETPLHGAVSGRATFWGGAMLEPDSLVGHVRLSRVTAGQGTVEIRNNGPVEIELSGTGFRVARAQFAGPATRLTMGGRGSVRRGLATTIDGELDLALLATLTPVVTEARGIVAMHVNMSGPFDNPAIYGNATVRDAGFRFASFPQPLDQLSGRITFSARRILLEDFRARFAGGNLALRGWAALEGRGIERYELDVDARGLAFAPEEGVDLALGGRAQLAWRDGQRLPILHGTLRVERMVYTRPIHLGRTLDELGRRERTEVEQYDPAADRLQLDLAVAEGGALRVANNLIEADMRIDNSERPFRIVGTDQRFGVLGKLAIRRGTLRFRNAEFDVRRGVISFNDETRVEPSFDVRATTTVHRSGDQAGQQWRIALHAFGTADALQLETSSEPDLSQEDIVLLLTVGMTRAEADQLHGGDVTGTAALEALSMVTGVDREVRRAVPVIDDFRLSSAYSVHTNRTEPRVSIGKRIANRVRLRATTGLSEAREFRTSVEWQVGDQSSVEVGYDNVNTASGSSVGNVGVDYHWRLEFE